MPGSEGASARHNGNGHHLPRTDFWALTIGAIGVVYGDIGTSPLYAFREAMLAATGPGGPSPSDGSRRPVADLLVADPHRDDQIRPLLLRADNNGEGGTLALMALAQRALGGGSGSDRPARHHRAPRCSTATPSSRRRCRSSRRSRASKVVAPSLDAYVVPLTIVILVGLFLVQSRGTARVAAFFGPIMAFWFLAIALARRSSHIAAIPRCLRAFNPLYGSASWPATASSAFVTLGAVFLAVTGAEALYADLGHFGRKPIQMAWLGSGAAGAHAQLFRPGRARPRPPGGRVETRSS